MVEKKCKMKSKGNLHECFDFCNPDYQQAVTHLSLQPFLNRILKKLPSGKVKLSE